MATLRRRNGKLIDENGREVSSGAYIDPENGIPGQMTLGEMPDHTTDVFQEQERYSVVEEDGSPVEDHELILSQKEMLTDEDVRSTNFFAYLKEKPQMLLDYLLSKQSNAHPLKKGGKGIAYKCEALILGTRAKLTDHENLLFDIILATVSSLPDNDVYTVYLADIMPYLPYKDKAYIEDVFEEAKEGLSEKSIKINIPNEGAELNLHLVGPAIFKRSSEIDITDKSAFYSFTLEPMVKALMISSGFTHGAHYKVEWAAQLKKYAKQLFFWLENLKGYKAYPDAIPGVIYVEIDRVREMLNVPSSYKDCDIKAKVLDPSIKKINSVPGIDIQTTCKVKTAPNSKKTIGYIFTITQVKDLTKAPDKKAIEEKSADRYQVETGILMAYRYSEKEIAAILHAYEEYNRGLQFLTQAVTLVESVASRKEIISRSQYLCKVIENGIATGSGEKEKKANTFNDFSQRDLDYDELERMALNTKPAE